MKKSIFLHVSGEGFAAMEFEEHFNEENVYQQMVGEGVTEKTFETDDYYIEVKIMEFGEVDSKFITYICNHYIDYDQSKEVNFYRIQ